MPAYLPITSIRHMTYTELERWWEVDFDALSSTAVAEAIGPVHQSVREALASDDWIEQWADALFSGVAELMSSVERMEYFRDPRLRTTRQNCAKVTARMNEVNRLVKGKLRAQGWEMAPEGQKDSHAAARAILGKCHMEEFSELREDELGRKGLPVDHPLHSTQYADAYDNIEGAVEQGIISAPTTPEVQNVLALPGEFLRTLVARDVTKQADRCDALRHPLLLRRWSMALHELLEKHCELNGIHPSFTLGLPRLDMDVLRGETEDDARKTLNRRRFIRALAQRNRECELHKRQLVRVANVRQEEILRPWRDASHVARKELARRYPEEFAALTKAFEPYCEPGTTVIQHDSIDRKTRSDLVHELRQKLKSGTLLV